MKRFLPLILIFMLLLSGCSVKEYTPEIPNELRVNALVTSGDFSFNCEICKNDDFVRATVLDTAAKDMVMTFDGADLTFVYADYDFSVDGSSFEKSNIAIVIYQLFEALNSDEIIAKKIDGGYQYKGKIDIGDLTLIQDEDNTFKVFSVPAADYTVEFDYSL
ncbi:MAG: hypothetical protein NC397_09425 [Clostridium sp.]|nr:hypothetical protein [Clostridium sp.]